MSDKVDRRIVEMRFDNEQFEKNVGQTLITLDTLKKALEMSGTEKGLENVTAAAKNVDLSSLQNGVEQTTSRFSAMEVMAVTALANITNSAVNAGKNLVSSFISPLIQGGKQRAANMAQAKFMFEGFQYGADQIGSADKPGTILGEVYKSVEGTFYSLDKAALVASQFLATGMGVDELQKNLKGVAGVASVFGADYQRVGEIFAKVRTQGKLMGQDLMSLNVMGVPTIAKITEYLNKDLPEGAKKTQEEVSAMVSKGQIDFDMFAGAMEMAFGDQAAKSKKLFTGAVEDMRAAMARIGEKFWTPMLELGRDFFNASVPLIDNFSAALDNLGVYEGFANAMQKIGDKLTFVMDVLAALFDYKGTLDNLKSLVESEVIDESRVARLEKYKDKIAEIREALVKILNPIGRLLSALKKLMSSFGGGLGSIFKTLASGLASFLNVVADGAEKISGSGDKIVDFFTRLKNALAPLASGIFRAVESGLESLRKALGGLNFGKLAIDGLTAGLGVGLWNALKTLNSFATAVKQSGLANTLGLGTMVNEFRLTLIGLQQTLKVYQQTLKANVLLTIASAILALAIAVKILSTIPAAKLAAAVTAIEGLFASLILAANFLKPAATRGIIRMSAAISILASAVSKLSSVPNLGKGLLGVAALMTELVAFCLAFDRLKIKPRRMIQTATSMMIMAEAIRMLVKPVKELGALNSDELAQGLVAISGIMLAFGLFSAAITKIKPKALIKAAASMVLIAAAMRMLVKPIKELGSMNSDKLVQGLLAIGGALLEMIGYAAIMGQVAKAGGSILSSAAALVLMAAGVKIMAGALDTMSNISNAGQGLSVLFGSLVILAGAMLIMQNAIPGAAAMIIVAAALSIMAPAILLLSSLNFQGVVAGLAALAGVLLIFAGASFVIGMLPTLAVGMIALGGAMALLGVGVLTLGAGMTLLVGAFTAGIPILVNGITALATTIPTVAASIGQGIIEIIQVLTDNLDAIAEFFGTLIQAIVTSINTNLPLIVGCGIGIILALLNGINENIEQVTTLAIEIGINFINGISAKQSDAIDAGFNFIISFFDGMANAISERGPELVASMQGVLLALAEVAASQIPIVGEHARETIKSYRLGITNQSEVNSVKKGAKAVQTIIDKDTKGDVAAAQRNGREIVSGMNSGLNSMVPQLQATANRISNIVDEAIRKKNQIHSPSKRLMRTGVYMMMGLIAGIDSMIADYQNRADNISSIMIETLSASGSLGNISPTITPVFGTADLSSLTAAVNLGLGERAKETKAIDDRLNSLTKVLSSMTESMNSRALNNYITIDGSADPEGFADDLIRSFRLNARTV